VTESRAVSVVLAVAVLLAGCFALIAFGPLAVTVVLSATVLALVLERTTIFRSIRSLEGEVDELRDWCNNLRDALAAEEEEHEETPTLSGDETAGQPRRADEPTTQPIIQPPAPDDGPPTEPADVLFVMAKAVGARQPADYQQTEPTREQKNAAWVESELARFDFSGRNR